MRIYNNDGSEPEMCGNGIRCLAQFLKDLGEDGESYCAQRVVAIQFYEFSHLHSLTLTDILFLQPKIISYQLLSFHILKIAESYRINTLAGPIIPVMNADNTITVDMGEPILDGPTVPTTLPPNSEHNSVVEQTHKCNGKEWKISMVSMGNPHAIIFVNDLEKDIDFESDGPALESDIMAFPAKTNVEFVQVISPTHLKMKVWERGAGPTLACGTGTCALVVAAIRAGKIPRPTKGESVKVTLPGGDLFIEWREENNKVYMTGPGTKSFNGVALLK